MKFLIAGCGNIGRRHIKCIRNIYRNAEILAYRTTIGKDAELEKLGVKTYNSLKKALAEKPDFVFITNPTSLHVKTAMEAAKAGCNIFMEKPVSDSLKDAKKLQKLAKQKKIKVFVAYCLRFHPVIKKVKELADSKAVGKPLYMHAEYGNHLGNWRKADYRKIYSSKKKMGGGVLLDISHEIDYVRWIMGEPMAVAGMAGKISNLDMDAEDCSDMLLDYGKASAHIHLDCINKVPTRTITVIGNKGTIEADINKNIVKITKDGKTKSYSYKNYNPIQMYMDEIRHFVDCAKKNKNLLVDLDDGIKTLEIALHVR